MNKREATIKAQLSAVCSNLYFQPPTGTSMEFPCIVYSRQKIDQKKADNIKYKTDVIYKVIIIDRDPDSAIVNAVAQLPNTTHTGFYTKNNFNYDVFTMY